MEGTVQFLVDLNQKCAKMKSNLTFPLVSIVIPCYNDVQYIEQSVESVLVQTYPNKEVIVVDDGSDNKTKEKLRTIRSKLSNLHTQKNSGQSRARNVGIEKAQGEFVLVLDSDDFLEPSFCAKAVEAFSKDENIKLVSCHVRRIKPNYNDTYIPNGGELTDFLKFNGVPGSSMFRKSDWAKCGGYDESMVNGFEDWEYYIRMLKNGGKAYIVPEILFNYRMRSDSTTSRANSRKYELLKFIYIKHEDLYKKHFENFVDHLLNRLQLEEKEKIKNKERLEFRIGEIILSPLRRIKNLICN